jgi:hypothetical protein
MNGRQRMLVLGLAVAAAVLLAALAGERWAALLRADEEPAAEASQAEAKQRDQRADPTDKNEADVRTIPLEEIYTTTAQKGMKWAWHRKDAHDNIRELVGKLSRYGNIGASNIFLVRGRDFDEAVRATHRVFYGSMGVDTPVLPEQLSKSKPLWLVAYFGLAQSGPQEWQITSVTVEDRNIRVEFVRADHYSEESDPSTGDVTGYLFWIRVGELGLGNYALALFDRDQRESVLMRRVAVEDAR